MRALGVSSRICCQNTENAGSEIDESHCFDTRLNLSNGLAGIRRRISVRISWLLPIVSAEDDRDFTSLVLIFPINLNKNEIL